MSASNSNKVVLVTGANKGLGYDVVRLLATQHPSWVILLGSRDAANGEAALNKLRSSSSDKNISHKYENVHAIQIDVTSHSSITTAKELIKKQWGRVDILIQNAGIAGVAVSNPSYQTGLVLMSTNLYGVHDIDQTFADLLSPHSLIVYVSSEVGAWTTVGLPENIKQQLEQLGQLKWETIHTLAEDYLHSLDGPSSSTKYQWPNIPHSYGAYGMSKCLLNFYARSIARQHPERHLVVVTPGYCATALNSFAGHRSTEQGALSIIHPINHESEIEYGQFYRDGEQLPFSGPHAA